MPAAPQEAARPYRGRFAPTPSGPLHFGSMVAAVGSYLEARSHRGQWCLRIDDLDPPRVVPGAADEILRCLEGFGFEWDGPVVFQSGHIDAYHAAMHGLRNLGAIYPCGCSRSEIEALARQGTEAPVYPGTCRRGMAPERRARSWRIRAPAVPVEFADALMGIQRVDLQQEAGDFPLYRADGVYSFHLAASVDEAALGITDVVRGADLLESSARQIHVLHVLKLPVPRYVHLPVAVDARGAKLSKQTAAPAIDSAKGAAALAPVLRFLNQPVPEELARASCRELWAHAIAMWSLNRVGVRHTAPAPQ